MTLGPFNSDLTPTAVLVLQNSFLLIINIYKFVFNALSYLYTYFAFANVSIVHRGLSRRPTEACFFLADHVQPRASPTRCKPELDKTSPTGDSIH